MGFPHPLISILFGIPGGAAPQAEQRLVGDQLLEQIERYAEKVSESKAVAGTLRFQAARLGAAEHHDAIINLLDTLVAASAASPAQPVTQQEHVFGVIRGERSYQDGKWGSIQDRPHEVGAWLALVQLHATRAIAAWAGATHDLEALNELRKVLAIGVACAEQHGLPERV